MLHPNANILSISFSSVKVIVLLIVRKKIEFVPQSIVEPLVSGSALVTRDLLQWDNIPPESGETPPKLKAKVSLNMIRAILRYLAVIE